MKMNEVVENYTKIKDLIICPICHNKVHVVNNSFHCLSGHTFDLSNKGYVNFLFSKPQVKYSEDLFVYRNMIFKSGYYDRLLQMLSGLTKSDTVVLDVGCGEGYYLNNLSGNGRTLIGIDIVKEAIHLAVKDKKENYFFVGNLTNIPLDRQTVDTVLNILTPADYTEFKRIARKKVIKVIPGNLYLKEIREKIGKNIYSNQDVINGFIKEFPKYQKMEINYTVKVNKEMAYAFFKMTPLTFNVDIDKLDLSDIQYVTINLIILEGTV